MTDIETFLKRHEGTRFRHSEELIACIKSGQCTLESKPDPAIAPVPTSHALRVYRRRAEHLKQFDSLHAQNIRADVLALCEELEKLPDEMVHVWSFSMAPYFTYEVFESTRLHSILGCILAVDKKRIDEKAWEALWKGAEG